jgi:hypothetical protein
MAYVPDEYLIRALLIEGAGIILVIGASFIWSVIRSINRRDDPRWQMTSDRKKPGVAFWLVVISTVLGVLALAVAAASFWLASSEVAPFSGILNP